MISISIPSPMLKPSDLSMKI